MLAVAALAASVGYLLARRSGAAAIGRAEALAAELQAARSEAESLQSALSAARAEAAAAGARVEERERRIDELKAHELAAGELRAKLATLDAELAHANEDAARRVAELSVQRREFEERFENLANRIFDEKGRSFQSSSRAQLDDMLKPFREQLEGFRRRVDEVHGEQTRGQGSLLEQVRQLQSLNQAMQAEASNLTRALKGEAKTRGNWGEVILERVLETSGLTKGREYVTQFATTGPDGNRVFPDAVVHLPEGKDIVIDAKVALVDWDRVVAAETDEAREAALRDHLAALRVHLKGLSDKRYHEAAGIRTLDFVVMFIPIEPAFLVAVERDESLFREAFDRHVILAGASTLGPILRVVASIWRMDRQNRNVLKIAEEAGRLHDKFVGHVEALDKLGKQFESARGTYETVMTRLIGPGGVTSKIDGLRKLGAKASKQLPDHMLGDADEDEDPALPDGQDADGG
jgi:DNA recombination protein RmuC